MNNQTKTLNLFTRLYLKAKERRKWLLGFSLFDLVIVALLFTAITAYQNRNLVAAGNKLPKSELVDINGEKFTFNSDTKTVAYVWAPWCGVCKFNIDNAYDYQSSGWETVIIGLGEPAELQAFIAERGWPEAASNTKIVFGHESVARRFKVNAYPTTYWVNEERRVLSRSVGYLSDFGLWWRGLWFRLTG